WRAPVTRRAPSRARIFPMADEFFFNPFDEATRRDPFQLYARGRARRVYRHPGLPVVSLFRYADVMELLRDYSAFSNVIPAPCMTSESAVPPNMLGSDPPEHDRLRGLVNQAFTPKIIRRLEPRMEEIAESLLDAALERRRVDLVQALTYPLPVTVI